MNQSDSIVFRNLTIGYREKKGKIKTVVEDINASIQRGRLTCLIGANGVGKSTLLRTLCGFLPKVKGEVLVEGQDIDTLSNKKLSRTIGVVLTDKPQLQNMTVRELVGLGRSPYTGFWGTLSGEDEAVVSRSIEQVGITALQDRMIQTLSDGERQKVMIAKALAQQTSIIVLDEPTAFLDYPSKVEMMQLLHRLSRETDITIFLSTHDLELVLQIADLVWLLPRDNLHIGTPRELAANGSLSTFIDRKGVSFDRDLLSVNVLSDGR